MLERIRQGLQGGRVRAAGTARVARRLPSAELVDLICPADLAPVSARLQWARRVLTHYHGDAALSWPLLPWKGFGAHGVSAWRQGPLAAAASGLDTAKPERIDAHWPLMLLALLHSRPALKRAASARALLVEAAQDDSAILSIAEFSQGRLQALHRRRLDAPWADNLLAWQQAQEPDPATAAWLAGARAAGLVPRLVSGGLDAQASDPANNPASNSASTQAAANASPPWRQDFLRPEPRPSAWAWAGLALGSLLLLAAGWDTQEAYRQRAAALALVLPVASAPGAQRSAPEAVSTAALSRLNHPWREVFLAAEKPAVAGLSWLVLDHQAGGDLRLQGVSQSVDAVTRAATALRAHKPWQRVLIARLESEDTEHRFELTAQGPSLTP